MEKKEIILDWICTKIANGHLSTFSLNELVSDNHISKKTIYRYFENKQEMIHQALGLFLKRQENQILVIAATEQSATKRILDIQMEAFEGLKGLFPETWRSIDTAYKAGGRTNQLRCFFDDVLHRTIKDLLIEGIINQEFAPHSELEILTKKILFDLYGMLEFGQEELKQRGREKMSYLNSSLLLKGLSNQVIVPTQSN